MRSIKRPVNSFKRLLQRKIYVYFTDVSLHKEPCRYPTNPAVKKRWMCVRSIKIGSHECRSFLLIEQHASLHAWLQDLDPENPSTCTQQYPSYIEFDPA